ncbi:MAG TPA: hypothetical protein DEQ38_12240 [Elusimicrobia bacterium]|nr:hypothetical protein [Elusimicrobiota bacterium]
MEPGRFLAGVERNSHSMPSSKDCSLFRKVRPVRLCAFRKAFRFWDSCVRAGTGASLKSHASLAKEIVRESSFLALRIMPIRVMFLCTESITTGWDRPYSAVFLMALASAVSRVEQSSV